MSAAADRRPLADDCRMDGLRRRLVVAPLIALLAYAVRSWSESEPYEARVAKEAAARELAAAVGEHRKHGMSLLAQGLRLDALTRFEAAVTLSPSLDGGARQYAAMVAHELGAAAAARGVPHEAASLFRRAVGALPSHAASYAALGRVLLDVGSRTEALAMYSHAVALDPSSSVEQHNFGHLLTSAGSLDMAADAFRLAAAARPSRLAHHVHRLSLGWNDDAAQGLRNALALHGEAVDGERRAGPDGWRAQHWYSRIGRTMLASRGAADIAASADTAVGEELRGRLGRALSTELPQQGFAIVDGVFGDSAALSSCAALLATSPELRSRLKASTVGDRSASAPLERSDRVARLSVGVIEQLGPAASRCVDYAREVVLEVHALLALGPSSVQAAWPREEMQLACYGAGGRYAPHTDQESDADEDGSPAAVRRHLTAILYLQNWSTVDHGGALRLWPVAGASPAAEPGHGPPPGVAPVDLAPVAGRLVLFYASAWHEVRPLRSGGGPPAQASRCALTQWFSSVEQR